LQLVIADTRPINYGYLIHPDVCRAAVTGEAFDAPKRTNFRYRQHIMNALLAEAEAST
jgi:hypothetical protein